MLLQGLSHVVQESVDVATAIATSLLEMGVPTEGSEVEEDFVNWVRGLCINHVTVNIVTNGSVLASGNRSLQSCVNARRGGALPRYLRQAIRWYIITACSCGNERLLGIHKLQWWRLEDILHGGKLPGGGCWLKVSMTESPQKATGERKKPVTNQSSILTWSRRKPREQY